MKKAIIILAVLGVLIFAGVLIFKRSGGPSKASQLAPAESVFFVNIPNVPMTGFRWQQTALAMVAAESEVVDFLKKPRARLWESTEAKEIFDLLVGLKPGNIFLSIVGDAHNAVGALMGVQFWGKREDFDRAVARFREILPARGGAMETTTHRGIELIGSRHGDRTLWTAAAGRWGLFSSDLGILQSAIDRAIGGETEPGLGSSEQFLKTVSTLPADPDLLVFMRPNKAMESLMHAGQEIGADPISVKTEVFKNAEAVGAAWKMDGDYQRDTIFVLRPRDLDELPKLTHEGLVFTDEGTDFFFDFVLKFDALPIVLEAIAATHPDQALRVRPYVDVIAKAYGPECAIVGDWTPGKLAPHAFVALQVRDPEAISFPEFVATNIRGAVLEETNGVSVTTVPAPQGAFTLVQNDRFLLAGRDAAKLVALAAEGPANPTLASTATFEPAMKAYHRANEMFGYIDTRVVFENVYNTLVPVLRFSAMMMPSIGEVVDLQKLPAAGTIGKHLPPIVVSQKVSAEGTLLESSGPVSLSQFLAIGGGISWLSKNNHLGH